jgi:hypothetical protein
VYHLIAQDLLSPFDQEVVGEDTVNFAAEGGEENFTEGQKRTIVFNLFARYSNTQVKPSYTTFSTQSIGKDLEIFTQTSGNLFKKVCMAKTVFGQAAFARTLAEPTPDIAELQRRQSIVQALLDDPKLFALAEHCLDEVKALEPLLLSFFSQKNELRQRMLSDLYFNKELWSHFDVNTASWDRSPKLLMASEVANKMMFLFSLLLLKWRWETAERTGGRKFLLSVTALYFLILFKPKWFLKVAPFGIPASAWFLGKHTYEQYKDGGEEAERARVMNEAMRHAHTEQEAAELAGRAHAQYEVDKHTRQAAYDSLSAPGKAWNFLNTSIKSAYEKFMMLELVIYTPYQLFMEGQGIRNWYYKYKHLQAKFSRLQSSIQRLHSVNQTLLQQPQLLEKIVELQPMVRALENRTGISNDLKQLLTMLETPTFGKQFTIASNLGRIAAVNKLMLGARSDWVGVFEAIGYLDSYMSIARLMKKHNAASTTPFCFAKYETGAAPHIVMTDFWNPFHIEGAKSVVVNNVELGKTSRNMILTGPNTGGKSTVIKSMGLNALLAQTFGVAAARSCALTPFSTILTYIRVEDDIERGLSLYRAEVERAKQLNDAVAALPEDQFALIIIDEMFRGTARDQAALLSKWYAQDNLGKFHNCMLLEATHYPELIGLEQETNGLFENYKVEIERREDGTLHRTYVLKKGATTQNVAADILKEEGFQIKTA